MHEDNHMSIMTTLKKPTPERRMHDAYSLEESTATGRQDKPPLPARARWRPWPCLSVGRTHVPRAGHLCLL